MKELEEARIRTGERVPIGAPQSVDKSAAMWRPAHNKGSATADRGIRTLYPRERITRRGERTKRFRSRLDAFWFRASMVLRKGWEAGREGSWMRHFDEEAKYFDTWRRRDERGRERGKRGRGRGTNYAMRIHGSG